MLVHAAIMRLGSAMGSGGRAIRRLLFVGSLTLLAPASAQAVCSSISATALAFGTYTGVAVTNSTAAVTVNCLISQYSVGLSAGVGSGATVATRKMTSGANTLSYQMFQDAARSTNWGNTQGSDAKTGTTSGSSAVLPVYASLLAAQYPTPGTYTDTITVTEFINNKQTTFPVSATVQATCSFTTTPLAFGTYTGVALASTGTVVVTCTNTTPYQIGINSGLHGSGAYYNWNMAGPSGARANYSLYRDSAHTQLWGGTIGAGGDSINGTGSGTAQTLTFYGAVPPNQYVAPGAYSDTVSVILYY